MAKHHTEGEIFGFITGDFQCAWDALAEKPHNIAGSRGNFMFALQATIFLEWLCRLCKTDPKALDEFTAELRKIEPKYFTKLNARYKAPNDKQFTLPEVDSTDPRSLLGALWDIIRNGQAHEYHDIIVKLTDNKQWVLGIQGVKYGWPLSEVAAKRSSLQHLAYKIDSEGDLMLIVHPGAFFLDIQAAATNARLVSRRLTVKHLRDEGSPKDSYQFNLNQLEQALKNGGHVRL